MSEEDKRIMQRNFVDLKTNMFPNEIIDILFSAELITSPKREELGDITLPSQRNDHILNLISRGTYKHLAVFKDALHKSGQAHLAKYLP